MGEKNYSFVVLGGGCFWCMEAMYEEVEGVISVVSGYTGGESDDPSYEEVSSGKSGHVEVVKIMFDSKVISFRKIIDLFWGAHDPTTLNRQGADVGNQYRSEIFYNNDEEKKIILESMKNAQVNFSDKIVTKVSKITKFYLAEKYHQDFTKKNPNHPYVLNNIYPKLKKFRYIKSKK